MPEGCKIDGWLYPGEELRAAVEEWQAKRRPLSEGVPRLTTGFLDGTHPIVDAYELKVRRPANLYGLLA